MSLIDDALKKVSEEAARRDAVSTGAPILYAAGHGAERRRFRRGFAIGIGAGLLLVLLAAIAVLVGHRNRPVPRAAVAAAPARSTAPPPITEEVAVPPPAGPTKPGAKRPKPAAHVTASATSIHPRGIAPGAGAVPEVPGYLADGRSYTAKIDLPDGQAIELDGIVYSDTKPVALVNGRVLVAGDFIFDFRVVKIERDHITLAGRGTTFTMTMR